MDVRNSWISVCKTRVPPPEVGACVDYADFIVASMAPNVERPSVGNTIDVCTNMYLFGKTLKQAEIDMKLLESALPGGSSLLSITLNRFGTGGPGPNTRRGKRWREFAWKHHRAVPPSDQFGNVR